MKMLLIFILSTISLIASAQEVHLVIDVDGFLISGIPQKNIQKLSDKDRVLVAPIDGRTRSFYPTIYSGEVRGSLVKVPNLTIHFLSRLGARSYVTEVLKNIYVDKSTSLKDLVDNNPDSKIYWNPSVAMEDRTPENHFNLKHKFPFISMISKG